MRLCLNWQLVTSLKMFKYWWAAQTIIWIPNHFLSVKWIEGKLVFCCEPSHCYENYAEYLFNLRIWKSDKRLPTREHEYGKPRIKLFKYLVYKKPWVGKKSISWKVHDIYENASESICVPGIPIFESTGAIIYGYLWAII